MLANFGITTPATAPGSFYSYIIALQKARAVAEVGGRFYPAFTTRRRLPVAYRGSLERRHVRLHRPGRGNPVLRSARFGQSSER